MKTRIFLIMAAAAVALALMPLAQAEKDASSAPAVQVNDKVITKADVDMQTRLMSFQMGQRGQNVPPEMMRRQAADSLVKMELVLQSAEKAKIATTDQEVDAEIDSMVKRAGSREKLDNFLKQMNISETYFRKQIHDSLLVDKYIQQTAATLPAVSDDDLQKYYQDNPQQFAQPEQIRASHIVFKLESNATPEVKKAAHEKAERALARLKAGEDFATVAKEVSEGPSAPQGGDLGYFSPGQMVPEFEKAAFSLKVGEISDIVESPYGYHIIKVTDKKPAGQIPLADVKDKLKSYMEQVRTRDEVQKMIAEKMKAAKIVWMDESLKPETAPAPEAPAATPKTPTKDTPKKN